MSKSLLNKHGFRMVFESDIVVLTKSGLFVRKGYECGGMFKLSIMSVRLRMKNNKNILLLICLSLPIYDMVG